LLALRRHPPRPTCGASREKYAIGDGA